MKIKLNEKIKQNLLFIAVLTIVMVLTPYSFQKETMSFEQRKTSAATISLLGSLRLDSSYSNGVLTLTSTGLQLANIGLISNYVPVFQLPKEFAGLMNKSNFKTEATISYSIPYIGVGEAITLNNIGTVTGLGLITNNETLSVGASIPHLLGVGIGSPTVFTLSINLKNLGYNELPPSVEGKLTTKAGVFDTVLLEANVLNSTGAINILPTSYVDTVAPDKPYVKPINEKDTELTGTSEPGAVVKAALPDGTQKTAIADSAGKWSITINPQKVNTEVKATAADTAGNISGATSVTVAAAVIPDTEAPQQPIIKLIDEKTGEISGESEANAKIIVTLPNGNEVMTTASAEGKWSVNITSQTFSRNLLVKAVDAAGNTSESVSATMRAAVISGAEVPSTEAPEVEVPGTEAPEIEVPSTEAPEVEVPSEEAPEIEVPSEETPEVEVPSEEAPEIEVPGTEAPEIEVPSTEAPEVEVPSEEAPEIEVPSEETPEVEVPSEEAPEIELPSEEAPEIEVPSEETPEVEVPSEETPEVEVPSEEAPEIELPSEEAPEIEVPSEETPEVEVPSEETPEVEVPSEEAPATEVPSEETPEVELPSEEAPEIELPSEEAPEIELPSEETPEVEVPSEEAPEIELPSEEAPEVEVPSEEAPEIEVPSEGAPEVEVPSEEAPEIEVPSEEAPEIEVPSEEAPEVEVPSEEAPETEEPSTETPQEQVEVPDTEAPQQPVIKTVDEKTGEITGESEANAKIIVTIPDRSEVTTTADAEGKWTVTITPSMSSMELTIKAVDAAGNTSETVTETMQSTIIPVVEAPEIEEPEIETPEVEVPVIEEPETEVPSTEVPQEQVEMPDTEAPQQPVIKTVDAKTGEITGESEANAKIIVTLPNGNEVMTTASAEGKWSVNITSQTFSRNLLVKAVDAAGNTSESVSATMKATIITEIEAPSEETPATEEPSTETPATEEPSTETPATEEPSEETPATEEPSEETPAAEEPSEETPATEEPSTETPATEEPSTETPQEQVEVPDTEAPQQPVIKTVDEKTGEITGESEANAKIIVTLPDRSEVTTTADAEGKWTVTITPSMSSMELTIKAVDAAGNTSESVTETMQSTIIPVVEEPEIETPEVEEPEIETPQEQVEEPVTETPETEIPQEQVEVPDTEAPQQPVIKMVNAKTGEITGESEANAKIIVTLSDGSEVTTTANGEGKWTVKITPSMSSMELRIKAIDAAGNTSESVTATMESMIIPVIEEPEIETPEVEVPVIEEPETEVPSTEVPQEQVEVPDTEAPQQPVIKTVDEKTGEISGESEANAKIIVTLPDGSEVTTTADGEGKWTVTITPSISSMVVKIKVVDAAGNASESVFATVEPTIIPVIETPKVEVPEIELPTTEIPNTEVSETEIPSTETPQEQVEVPDTEAPQQPVIKTVDEKTGEISGESEANAKIIVTLPDGSEVTTTADGEGKWTVTITPSISSMVVKIKAVDAAGNTSESVFATVEPTIIPVIETPEVEVPEIEIPTTEIPNTEVSETEIPVIEIPETEVPSTETPQEQVEVPDTEAPQQPVIKTVNEKTGEISGESEANAKIIVTLPDGSEVTTTADGEGKWTVTITPSISSMVVKIKVVDAAGNASESVFATVEPTIIPVIETPKVEVPEIELPTTEIPNTEVSETEIPVIEIPETEIPSTETPQEQVEVPDTEAPQQPVIKTVNEKSGEISGESEANAKIIVTLPDGSEVTTTADGEGKWKVTVTPSMSNMVIRIKAVDAAGNASESISAKIEPTIVPVLESPEVEVPSIETPGTEIPSTEVPATETPHEQVELPDTEVPQQPVIKTVDEKTGEISGESEANAKVIVILPDESEVTTTADGEGKWKVTVTPSMSNMVIRIKAVDAAGNASESVSAQMESTIIPVIETQEVEIPVIVTPVTDTPQEQEELPDTEASQQPVIKTVNEKSGEISGESEANAKIIVTLPDGSEVTTTANNEGKWSVRITPQAFNRELRVTAINTAGIRSQMVYTTLNGDSSIGEETVTPVTEIIGEIPSETAGNTENLATETPVTKPNTVVDEGFAGTVKPIQQEPSDNKETGIPVPTGDSSSTPGAGGNEAQAPGTSVKPGAPAINQNAGNQSGEGNNTQSKLLAKNINVNSTVIRGISEANALITVMFSDGSKKGTVADSLGNWSISINQQKVSSKIRIIATDPAGNNRKYTSITVMPVLEGAPISLNIQDSGNVKNNAKQIISNIDNNGIMWISGTSEANATIKLYAANNMLTWVKADSNGNWSIPINSVDMNKEYSVITTNKSGSIIEIAAVSMQNNEVINSSNIIKKSSINKDSQELNDNELVTKVNKIASNNAIHLTPLKAANTVNADANRNLVSSSVSSSGIVKNNQNVTEETYTDLYTDWKIGSQEETIALTKKINEQEAYFPLYLIILYFLFVVFNRADRKYGWTRSIVQ